MDLLEPNVHSADNVVPTENQLLVESTTNENDIEPQIAIVPTSNNKNITPQRKRKKVACRNKWSRNILKKKIQSGEAHISISSGKEILGKNIRPKDCSNCIRKCNSSFSEEERITINENYWKIENINSKRHFLSSLIDVFDKGSCRTKSDVSKRQKTRKFYMVKNGEQIQVCQGFFLATFCISNTVVENIIKKRNDYNIVEEDRRGKHVPGIKRPDESRASVIEHISSFPRVPSHYRRKNTSKEYLPHDLNVSIMYELYVEKCKVEGIEPEKPSFYRNIFHNNFNLSFHTPRNDMCDKCYKFDNMNEGEKETNQTEHNFHIARKNMSREFRDKFKDLAAGGEIEFSEFDFEAVRYIPKVKAKAIFYKRRLAVYNMTAYNVTTRDAYNFMWHEGEAGRGGAEVSSCLLKLMTRFANGKKFAFMSDTCGGQNRNGLTSSMFLYAVENLDVPEIDHLFFEPGHSQMECDSVHAHIETSSKSIDIFDPSGWFTTVRLASKKGKYHVIEMSQEDIFNVKELQETILKNKKVDTEGNIVRWLDIVWFNYKKSDTDHIYFKYDMSSPLFLKFPIQRRKSRNFCFKNIILRKKYNTAIAIAEDKMTDLEELCKQNIIPKPYHSFYQSLKKGKSSDQADEDEDM